MENPFAQNPLPSTASVNRVRIRSDHPWATPYEGQIVGQILDRKAWIALLPPEFSTATDPLIAFDQSDVPTGELAQELGTRMAAFIDTLREGNLRSRANRPEWNDDAWHYWQTRETIVIGGGLVSGRLGPEVVNRAQSLLGPTPFLGIPPHPRDLAILGAAQSSAGSVLALDLGHSSLKRGLRQGQDFDRLPTLPVDRTLNARGLLNLLLDATSGHEAEAIRISVASYVLPNGNPFPQGFIGQLNELADNVPALLTETLGRPVTLLHDGTAAAIPFAGQKDTAVIVFGTALGVGIPPAAPTKTP